MTFFKMAVKELTAKKSRVRDLFRAFILQRPGEMPELLFVTESYLALNNPMAENYKRFLFEHDPRTERKFSKYAKDFSALCDILHKSHRAYSGNPEAAQFVTYEMLRQLYKSYRFAPLIADLPKPVRVPDAIDAFLSYSRGNCNEADTILYVDYLLGDGHISNRFGVLTPRGFLEKIEEAQGKANTAQMERSLSQSGRAAGPRALEYTLEYVDSLTGQEFEAFVRHVLERIGFACQLTKESNDQGIDIVATRGEQRLGVQAKCYAAKVGNGAVQEVVAGVSHYGLDHALVVTNSTFTPAAVKLAGSNGVFLWDRSVLQDKLHALVVLDIL